MRKNRILFIVPLPPPVHGSSMMCQYIRNSKLVNEAFDCDYINLSTSRRIDEIGRQSIMKIFRFVGSYFAVLWHLIIHRYNACYLAITCHGIGFLKDAPFVLLCKLFNCRVIIHQHNQGMANYVDRWPYRWLLPLVYRNSKVILLSWKLYPDIERVVRREQVVICPNGIPDIDTKPHIRNNDIPHLLFLSNLIESKGVIDLLDACEILIKQGYKFVCNFIGGESKEIDSLRFTNEVNKRNLDNVVFYLGRKYGADKEEFFANSDIFAFPSYFDCFPLVLLEAMQQGLPVVSTDVGATSDIVENDFNGLICEQKSPRDLASKLAILLDNCQLRQKFGSNGMKKYLENFTISNFEQNIITVLKTSANPND